MYPGSIPIRGSGDFFEVRVLVRDAALRVSYDEKPGPQSGSGAAKWPPGPPKMAAGRRGGKLAVKAVKLHLVLAKLTPGPYSLLINLKWAMIIR